LSESLAADTWLVEPVIALSRDAAPTATVGQERAAPVDLPLSA
jgi:hypothetical protein